MNWYSAHIIMFVELKQGPQDRYPIWENIVLIGAGTEEEAFEKAERHGRSEEGDCDGSFRWGNQPARWIFAGVRKLTECESVNDRPGDGTELSYTELELDSREAVKKFATGKPVTIYCNDRFRPAKKGPAKKEVETKQSRRRRV